MILARVAPGKSIKGAAVEIEKGEFIDQFAFTIPDEVLYDTKMNEAETMDFVKKAVALRYYTKAGVSLGYCAMIADRSNETKADLFELRNKAGSFASQYLRTTLWEEDIELEDGSETYQLVFRQGIDPDYDYSKATKTIPDCDNPDKMYLNGYELGYYASHRSFKEYEENTLSADRNDYPGNSGEFWVINTGVLACDLYIWDESVEELAEGTFILAFDTLMESFCEQLTERLDVSNLSGYELSCTSAQLIFYPIPSEVSKQEVTYVPAWGVVLGGRDGPWTDTLGVKVILNAIDGKMLLFDQTMIDYN